MGTTRSSNNTKHTNQNGVIEPTYTRRAKHAGSWYTSSPKTLKKELSDYLSNASTSEKEDSKHETATTASSSSSGDIIPCGIISPHAGYSYSGSTAAYAYLGLKEALEGGFVDTIVVLHPSHYVHLDGCAISGASSIETPIGNMKVNTKLRSNLLSTNKFTIMTQSVDEREHSGEMQYPYIAHILNECNKQNITILPIMIGSISKHKEQEYGTILQDHLIHQPNIFTIISSDFCHWGTRFQYTPTDPTKAISSYIQWLDQLGMDQIELKIPGAFVEYLKKYRNTICGRHPIAVYLFCVGGVDEISIRFVKYSQSSEVKGMGESSVSYASAIVHRKIP